MIVLCDTCSILMLIRIAPNMFTDSAFEIDFATQEFSDDFKGNFSPLQLIVTWLKKGLIVWDDSKHQILEEWAITEENRQPAKAKIEFKKRTGRPYPGP